MKKELIDKMNSLGKNNTPFLFLIDFSGQNGKAYSLDALPEEIQYTINSKPKIFDKTLTVSKEKIPLEDYKSSFQKLSSAFENGEVELLNLTAQTRLHVNLNLADIYTYADAKYKLWWKDHFVCFSPETFVKITANKIYSYPMKGTIDASLKDAENKLLDDTKEQHEHEIATQMIVEDLQKVAKYVRVKNYRYIEKVKTHTQSILQSSSEIEGELKNNWKEQIGSIFSMLLPAGSISGYPKRKSIELIAEIENYNRGFYTGVFGVFDGENVDSGVMIRFIEKTDEGLVFKSGGGVTKNSDMQKEYDELNRKIYVPVY